MPTPSHTDFDPNNPQGSQTPTAAIDTSAIGNFRALRDMVITGFAKGFVQSRTNGTGTASQPQYITWYNSSTGIGFRWNITWTGFNPTTIVEEWTNDSQASWTTVLTHVLTFDASQNVTACTTGAGCVVVLAEAWAKALKVTSDLAAHTAAIGTSVHGLGSMATQAASAVAITGGTEDGVEIGQTTPGKGDFKRVRETIDNAGSARVIAAAGTATPDPSLASYFKIQPSATQSDTMTIAAPSNPPSSSRTHTFKLEIVNGKRSADGKITWNAAYHWVGGSGNRPLDTALEASGSNLFTVTWNGASWDISHDGKRG